MFGKCPAKAFNYISLSIIKIKSILPFGKVKYLVPKAVYLVPKPGVFCVPYFSLTHSINKYYRCIYFASCEGLTVQRRAQQVPGQEELLRN